jgi:hypothetical protein
MYYLQIRICYYIANMGQIEVIKYLRFNHSIVHLR